MSWKTVYILGKPGFRGEIDRKVFGSELEVMPGATGESDAEQGLYWLDHETQVREMKEAIGGKLIWKYRLRFFESLEDFLHARSQARPLVKPDIDGPSVDPLEGAEAA